MDTSRRFRCTGSLARAMGVLLLLGGGFEVRADAPAAQTAQALPAGDAAESAVEGEPRSLPQDGLFSSIKQSLREGDQEIVRGHFDLGSPPNVHRYYCLMDPKTRRREPNGVLGDPIPRPDGMTGIKSSAVSLYRCEKAEQQGMLVTAGYVVPAHSGPATASSPPPMVPAAASAPAPAPPPPGPAAMAVVPTAPEAAPEAISRFPSGMVDVSGVTLGMSPDEVRAVLKSKKLRDDHEWSENLSYRDPETGKMQPVANGRFVNVIAASSAVSAAADGNYETDGESFEVMFTPVPGHERALAIVHTVGYSSSNSVHESALEAGLIGKYGGFAAGDIIPQSATWLYRSGGTETVGDSCGRRGVFGGLGALRVLTARENVSLRRSAEELEFEVQRCGIAIVTEDHHTANGGALREDRMVTRYTITAYSPALAADGAAQAEAMVRAAGRSNARPVSAPAKDSHAPDL